MSADTVATWPYPSKNAECLKSWRMVQVAPLALQQAKVHNASTSLSGAPSVSWPPPLKPVNQQCELRSSLVAQIHHFFMHSQLADRAEDQCQAGQGLPKAAGSHPSLLDILA